MHRVLSISLGHPPSLREELNYWWCACCYCKLCNGHLNWVWSRTSGTRLRISQMCTIASWGLDSLTVFRQQERYWLIWGGHCCSWRHPSPHPLSPLSSNVLFALASGPVGLVSAGGSQSSAHPCWIDSPNQAPHQTRVGLLSWAGVRQRGVETRVFPLFRTFPVVEVRFHGSFGFSLSLEFSTPQQRPSAASPCPCFHNSTACRIPADILVLMR